MELPVCSDSPEPIVLSAVRHRIEAAVEVPAESDEKDITLRIRCEITLIYLSLCQLQTCHVTSLILCPKCTYVIHKWLLFAIPKCTYMYVKVLMVGQFYHGSSCSRSALSVPFCRFNSVVCCNALHLF